MTPTGAGSLRERKRARARRDLQRAAVALVERDGYQATTIEEICAAAEVSKSSFFRYFGTKEAVFRADLIEEAALARWTAPRARSLDDLCELVCAPYEELSQEDWDLERRRIAILQSVPELRPSLADEVLRPFPWLVEYLAAMLGQPAGSTHVRTLAGAVFGVIAGRFLPAQGHRFDLPASLDDVVAEIRAAFDDFARLAPALLERAAPASPSHPEGGAFPQPG